MHPFLSTPTAAPVACAAPGHVVRPSASVRSALPGMAAWGAGRWLMACMGLCVTLGAAAEPAIYLLGEVHDNPQGHSLRLQQIANIVRTAPQPVIAMEQFDRDKQGVLDAAMRDCADAACVIERAGGSGWDWPAYAPVIDLALRQRVPLVAANVSLQEARLVVRKGLGAVLDAGLLAGLGLDQGVPPAVDALQREAVFQGHCRMVPKQSLGGMVQAQVARDVWMAYVVQAHARAGATVLLLAGNGHVRKDAGVYQWLAPMERQRTQVYGYVEHVHDGDGAWFDQVQTLMPVQRGDPCAAFTAPAS